MNDVELSFDNIAISDSNSMIGSLGNISFQLKRGEIGLIFNQIISKKITHIILGRQRPQEGTILFAKEEINQKWSEKDINWRQQIGVLSSDSILLSNLTIIDNVDLPAVYHGHYTNDKGDKSLAVKALKEANVLKKYWDLRPSDVPPEMVKMALLARSVVLSPSILILEEIDFRTSWPFLPDLFQWIKIQKNKKTAILLSASNIPFGLCLSDWVLDEENNIKINPMENLSPNIWAQQAQSLIKYLEST